MGVKGARQGRGGQGVLLAPSTGQVTLIQSDQYTSVGYLGAAYPGT